MTGAPVVAALINHTSANVFFAMAVIVIVARLTGMLFRRIRQPAVVGEIIAGILLGKTFLGALPGHLTQRLFPSTVQPGLNLLAQLGVVLFMFIVGLEVDLGLIKGRARLAVSVSLTSIALPFGLGVGLAAYLHSKYDRFPLPGGGSAKVDLLPFMLFIGAAMSITAFPVLARILGERGMHKTELGTLALACAAVDDLVAWSLLALVISIVEAKGALDLPKTVALAAVFMAVLVFVVRPAFEWLIARTKGEKGLSVDLLAAVLVGLLVSSFVTDHIGIHSIFGAFAFGAILPKHGSEATVAAVVERLESVTVVLLLPLFFIVTGLAVDVRAIGFSGFGSLLAVLAVAIGGKFVGASVAARTQGLTGRRAMAVGTLMNTRGLTELVILDVGRSLGVLNPRMHTIMVVMAVVTTVMTEPLLRIVYPDRLLKADLADAEKGGGEAPTYLVTALLEDEEPGPLVDLAADLAGRGGAVVAARFLARPPEVTPGLGTDLIRMATTMEKLSWLGRGHPGVEVRPLAQFSADPLSALVDHLARTGADAVVVDRASLDDDELAALLDRAPCHVVVRRGPARPGDRTGLEVDVAGGADAEAALELALRLRRGQAQRGLPGPPVRLAPAAETDSRRARRWAERVNALGVAGVEAELAQTGSGPVRFVGVGPLRGRALDAALAAGDTVLAVRSGDDPDRVGFDQHLARLAPAPGDGHGPAEPDGQVPTLSSTPASVGLLAGDLPDDAFPLGGLPIAGQPSPTSAPPTEEPA